jgi:hypothetical protein
MSELSRALVLTGLLNLLSLLCGLQLHAQAWLPGYNYRKKITINKAMVSGSVDLQAFQLLVALEHADLKYVAGACSGNKLSGTKGRDFAFTTVSAPQTTLRYQLDEYVPATGKLVSWVHLNTVAAAGTKTPATQIYLYYGSNTIHFPAAASAQQTWNGDQDHIWHMNPELAGTPLANAASSMSDERLLPATSMNASNVVPGKIGNAIALNGTTQYLTSGKINSSNFLISCWIKFAVTDREQVIVSTDSADVGGYVLKLGADGRLVQETRSFSILNSRRASLQIVPDRWYHVVSQSYQGRRDLLIDGVSYNVGLGNTGLRAGGSLIVGSNKQQGQLFSGLIDELRIQTISPTVEWLVTSYTNQRDPTAFYVVAAEEKNASLIATGMVFSNTLNQNWSEPANWNSHEVPGNFEQVLLDSGAKAAYTNTAALSLNKLTLKGDAQLVLQRDIEVLCETQVEAGGKLNIGNGVRLQLDGKLLNDGFITSSADAAGGSLAFSGASAMQQVTGNGKVLVNYLLLDKPSRSAILQLEQSLDVLGYVRATMGQLRSNGYLTLKNSGPAKQAFLWPMSNAGDAAVVGEVTVEQYIAGGFPAPATARNWRLLSAPVYHGSAAGFYYHHLYDWKAAMFVTGPGGARNGFDESPQNGHTIYTHNQSIIGALSQKYVGIATMQATVDVGRGIYVFSRGDRLVPDAFTQQILSAPFQRPESFLIHHKGLLFQGSLQVQVQNRNMGESGDGFNLLGNPYAAAISWSALQKENLSPYVWKFNPLNNAYDVSNDPNTTINAGEGFFVKVLNGHNTGSLTFSESAKLTGSGGVMRLDTDAALVKDIGAQQQFSEKDKAVASVSAAGAASSLSAKQIVSATAGISKLTLKLVSSVFEQQFTLLLSPEGQDDVDDQDATALGTGYVSISSVATGGTKLSVDARRQPGRRMLEVPLYVKGYTSGKYELHISGVESLAPGTELTLVDNYLNTARVLQADQVHLFEMNTDLPESFGDHRFSLRLKTTSDKTSTDKPLRPDESDLLVYPNPFVNGFKLRLPILKPCRIELRLRNLMGKVMLRRDLGLQDGTSIPEVDASGLPGDIYLMELIDLDTGRTIKASKLIKR